MTDILFDMKNIQIEGRSDRQRKPIIKGVDLSLKRGETLGLIGESGAGKSTFGLAAMGYTKGGCRIGEGSISFDGQDLTNASSDALRQLRGKRIAYVAQSAATAFNPAFKLINNTAKRRLSMGLCPKPKHNQTLLSFAAKYACPTLTLSAFAILTKYPVGNFNAQ